MTHASRSFAHLRSLPLDFEVCYRAVCSRDARFDGQFFTAVTSTGIYCRPICPAPTPKPEQLTKTDWSAAKNVEVRRIIQERMGKRFVSELACVLLYLLRVPPH